MTWEILDKLQAIQKRSRKREFTSKEGTCVSRIPPPATRRTQRWKPFIKMLRYHFRCTIEMGKNLKIGPTADHDRTNFAPFCVKTRARLNFFSPPVMTSIK
jgi:hypothetical protein